MIITVMSYNTYGANEFFYVAAILLMGCFGTPIFFFCLDICHVCSLSDVVYNSSSLTCVAEICKGTINNEI